MMARRVDLVTFFQLHDAFAADPVNLAGDQIFDLGNMSLSAGVTMETATPLLPARPVRPMRWT